MDFIKLRIVNFLTITDSGDLWLQKRGLNLIQGINEGDSSATSNGAGKSSIVDALCWALYGATARDESGDAIVNNVAKKDCYVEVVVRDGATEYTITRYRKHSTGKNDIVVEMQSGGSTVNLSKGKGMQEEIDKIIGCDHEVFKAAIYSGQEDMPDIPKMTDKQLKVLIEQAAGITILEEAYRLALKKVTAADTAQEKVLHEAQRLSTQVHAFTVQVEAAKLKAGDFDATREARAKVEDDQAEAHSTQAKNLFPELQQINDKAAKVRIEQIDIDIAGATEVTKAAADYHKNTLNQTQIHIAAQRALYIRKQDDTQHAKQRLDNAPAELEKPCGACGKPHTPDELDKLKAHLTEHVKALARDTIAEKKKLSDLEVMLQEQSREHARLEGQVPDTSKLHRERALHAAEVKRAEALRASITQTVERVKEARARAEVIRAQENPHEAVITHIGGELLKTQAALEVAQHNLKDAEKALQIAQDVASIYAPAGVRAQRLDTVTPFLNERTAEYLSTLSDGNISATWSTLSRNAKGEVREKFAVDVVHDQGGERFGLISGGEKNKVRWSCMLALQDLVASRASKPIGLWVGDEIDKAVDGAGLERLMSILEKKAHEQGTVLVISHNALGDWIDRVTTVTKTAKGMSTVFGALCEP